MSDEELSDLAPVKIAVLNLGEAEIPTFRIGTTTYSCVSPDVVILGHRYLLGVNPGLRDVAFADLSSPGVVVRHPYLYNSVFHLEGAEAQVVIDFVMHCSGGFFDEMENDEVLVYADYVRRVIFRVWQSRLPEIDIRFSTSLIDATAGLLGESPSKKWGLFKRSSIWPSLSTLAGWIAGDSFSTNGASFGAQRKEAQMDVFSVIAPCLDGNPESAYLAVLLLSGRGNIPEVRSALQYDEVSWSRAMSVVRSIRYYGEIRELGCLARRCCSIEVVNELREGNMASALHVAEFAVSMWPESAVSWRCRGIVELGLGKYGEAYRDLSWARELGERRELLDSATAEARRRLGEIPPYTEEDMQFWLPGDS
jgi:hypothetical protein